MCRNIKTLFNFEPPVTDDEVRAASLQFVRKLSGFNKPSKANEAAFALAVDRTVEVARALMHSLVITAPPRDRNVEAEKARQRAAVRFGDAGHVGRRESVSERTARAADRREPGAAGGRRAADDGVPRAAKGLIGI